MRPQLAHSGLLLAWRVLLLIAAILAGLWFWAMPGGFPIDHPRFWANRAAPIGAIAVAGFGWLALWKDRPWIYLPITSQIEAWSRLKEPVFSHLNSFCTLMVRGHGQLSVSWSPCPASKIDIVPSDYPVGRPVRLAYLDAVGMFHVAEATSGEKGPFHDLATGRLGRGHPLQITLWDTGRPVCRISLSDWSQQCGVDLSPTAGWRLPVNAIEFSRLGEGPNATCGFWITLAGTSVGRGWDSVGHAQGTYRNRMTIEPVAE